MQRQTTSLLILCAIVTVHFVTVTLFLPILPFYTQGTWIETTFAIAHVVGLLSMGKMMDRIGIKRVLLLSLSLQMLSLSLLAFSPFIITSRLLSGYAISILPCVVAWIAHELPPTKIIRANALLMLSITIGTGLGAGISGFLPPAKSAIILLFFCFLALSLVSRWCPRAIPSRQTPPSKNQPLLPFLWRLAMILLLVSTGFHLVRTLFPFLLPSLIITSQALISLTILTGVIQLAIGLSPASTSPKTLFRVALLSLGLGFLLFSHLSLLSISIFFLALGIGIADPAFGAILSTTCKTTNTGGKAGVIFGFGAIGKILGPMIAGILLSLNIQTYGFLVAFGFVFFAFVLSLRHLK